MSAKRNIQEIGMSAKRNIQQIGMSACQKCRVVKFPKHSYFLMSLPNKDLDQLCRTLKINFPLEAFGNIFLSIYSTFLIIWSRY